MWKIDSVDEEVFEEYEVSNVVISEKTSKMVFHYSKLISNKLV